MKKPDFLDDVVDEEAADKKFGAKLEDEDEGGAEDTDEEAQEDQILAAKKVAKALGVSVDAEALAEALKAFCATCM